MKQYRRTIHYQKTGSAPQPQFRRVAGFPKEIPMITQPNAHIEARPTERPVQHEPHTHLPRRSTQTPNMALVGLQLIVGYAWLLAGVDKLLLGVFPAQLGGLLHTPLLIVHFPASSPPLLRSLPFPTAV